MIYTIEKDDFCHRSFPVIPNSDPLFLSSLPLVYLNRRIQPMHGFMRAYSRGLRSFHALLLIIESPPHPKLHQNRRKTVRPIENEWELPNKLPFQRKSVV